MRPDGRSKRDGEPFVRLSHRFLDSPAVAEMSPEAFKLLVCGLWRRHNGSNNGDVSFSLSEAQALLRCSRWRAAAALAELEARGAIRRTQEAAMLGRSARRWAITEEPEPNGAGHVRPTHAARNSTAADQTRITAELTENAAKARAAQRSSRADSGSDGGTAKAPAEIEPRFRRWNRIGSDGGTAKRTGERRSAVAVPTVEPQRPHIDPLCSSDGGTGSNIPCEGGDTARPVLHVIDVSESGAAAPERRRRNHALKPPPDPTVAAKIRSLLVGGMTQKAIGARLGYSRSHIAAVLQGVNRIGDRALDELERLVAEVTTRATAARTGDP